MAGFLRRRAQEFCCILLHCRKPTGNARLHVWVTRMDLWTRRSLIAGALASPAAFAGRRALAADTAYPARKIQFLIPYAPGGGFDVYVRVIAPVMEEYLPHRVNIVP